MPIISKELAKDIFCHVPAINVALGQEKRQEFTTAIDDYVQFKAIEPTKALYLEHFVRVDTSSISSERAIFEILMRFLPLVSRLFCQKGTNSWQKSSMEQKIPVILSEETKSRMFS